MELIRSQFAAEGCGRAPVEGFVSRAEDGYAPILKEGAGADVAWKKW